MSLAQLRSDFDTRFRTIPGLEVYETIRDSIEVPAVVVGLPDGIGYNLEMGGGTMAYMIVLQLLAGRADLSTPVRSG